MVSMMVTLNYTIDDDLHRRVKVAAAQRGVTIKALVIAALEAELERDAKKKR